MKTIGEEFTAGEFSSMSRKVESSGVVFLATGVLRTRGSPYNCQLWLAHNLAKGQPKFYRSVTGALIFAAAIV